MIQKIKNFIQEIKDLRYKNSLFFWFILIFAVLLSYSLSASASDEDIVNAITNLQGDVQTVDTTIQDNSDLILISLVEVKDKLDIVSNRVDLFFTGVLIISFSVFFFKILNWYT